jgi:surface carbohydrate biosynthesis protein
MEATLLGRFMDILIPIETASRELLYKVHISRLLALQGYNCYIGSKTQIYMLLGFFSNYIYLDKGYHPASSDNLYKIIKKNNGIIVSLDEEGAVDYSNGSTLQRRYSEVLFNKVDFAFLWGQKIYELIQDNIIDKSKVKISGHPRFELLKPKFQYLYSSDVKIIKEKYGKFILINTNMGFGNNIKGDEFVINNYEDRFPEIKNIIDFDKEKLNLFCQLVTKLSTSTDLNIIFRPHPEEDNSFYIRAFAGLSNVKIIYEKSVIPWLIACEKMIHPDCTTAIEAFFLGKEPISLLPGNSLNARITKLPLNVSTKFNRVEHVIKYLETKNVQKENTSKEKMQLIEDYFSYSMPTIEIIINQLGLIKENISHAEKNKILIRHFIHLKIRTIIPYFKRKKTSTKLRDNKLEGFNINNITFDYRDSLNEKGLDVINCKELNSELFYFSKKIYNC